MKINGEVKKDDFPKRENKSFKRAAKILAWYWITGITLSLTVSAIALAYYLVENLNK